MTWLVFHMNHPMYLSIIYKTLVINYKFNYASQLLVVGTVWNLVVPQNVSTFWIFFSSSWLICVYWELRVSVDYSTVKRWSWLRNRPPHRAQTCLAGCYIWTVEEVVFGRGSCEVDFCSFMTNPEYICVYKLSSYKPSRYTLILYINLFIFNSWMFQSTRYHQSDLQVTQK